MSASSIRSHASLRELRPATLYEVRMLLEFVQPLFSEGIRTDGTDEKVFVNVLKSLSDVKWNIENEARERALNKAIAVVGAMASPDRNKRHT
jgi:hypothetical protein